MHAANDSRTCRPGVTARSARTAALLLLGAFAVVAGGADALISVQGSGATFAHADFLHISAPYGTLDALLVPVRVLEGCVLQLTASIWPNIALYDFNEALAAGCHSYGDIITATNFAAINASVSVFVQPATLNKHTPGFNDPVGYVATYIDKGYALTIVHNETGWAIEQLIAASSCTLATVPVASPCLAVSITSDAGEWARVSGEPVFLAYHVLASIVFWFFAVYSFVALVLVYVNDRSLAALVGRLNHQIYFGLFFFALLRGIEVAVDPLGILGLLTLGQSWALVLTSYLCMLTTVCLLLIAWIKVVASVPNTVHNWLTLVATAYIYFCIVLFIVAASIQGALYFYGTIGTTLDNVSNVLFTILAVAIALLCLAFLGFGGRIMLLLSSVKMSSSSRRALYKITSIMGSTVLGLLFFIILLSVNSFVPSAPTTYMIFSYVELLVLTLVMASVVVSLRVNAFVPFRTSDKNTSSQTGSAARKTPTSAARDGGAPGTHSEMDVQLTELDSSANALAPASPDTPSGHYAGGGSF